MATNAAVYLESLLRNVEWDDWVACWGPSFDSAFGNDLSTTRQGQVFLASVSQPRVSVADEVAYWQRYGLQSYELQWQNFKIIGLDNTYSIVNALGLTYPFTLQRSQGQFRLEFQTTYKLYWSLANDLANLQNQTSLLRSSPVFAYANTSLEDVYLANATFLTAPLPAGYAVVGAALGPFGAIDAKYVEVPPVVRAVARDIITIDDHCLQVPSAVAECEATLTAVTQWTSTMAPLHIPSQSVAMDALVALNISLMQYGYLDATSPLALFTTPILDENFVFFGSMFVLEWLRGERDVVTFTGDNGSLTLLSDLVIEAVEPVEAAELSSTFALYAHATVQYITYVMAGLAAVAGVYIVVSRGRIEGLNMLELSRVGGIVWVGRPLLVVRSVSALCLLSTATSLSLHYPSPHLVSFATEASSALTTCLAASEVTWLVGILNDIFLVTTREHSTRYTTINSVLVWAMAACLTTLRPVHHKANMDFRCVPTALDLQVTCSTGTIAIGCYGLVRSLWPVSASVRRSESLLLTAGAKFLFSHDGWLLGDVYYMDRASALLSGLVTVSWRGSLLVFDVKTWRLQPMYTKKLAAELVLSPRLATALPLPDTPIEDLV
ncbi:hypothetical protein SPRG_16432 [Saprolegnia parasitica CBS 223.65]|uniref:Uncharacterized protein n=1 Tax=Saprolegnia parasitica (strain CBS 223.65) TaxID=695850 RepID=A0A067BU71_SAPPC|nr:hypothetical protein SPRG_16432 [Saprolegnia parasitica CBS 223.65]KDO18157.1 hypothetical protein SPRG_16432 [Saprolegnia parasitica CBS 223.65]|eukprot:XP_012211131.1 hypothetical protein SPRG_16432 [Saprolegnia parasitica CBS 223.65]